MPSANTQPAEPGAQGQHPAPSDPILKTVTTILEYAVQNGASDIHLEPRASFVQVRYRIDGLLREAMTLPLTLLPQLVQQLKTMAKLNPEEQKQPQEGKCRVAIGDQTVDLTISILPVVDGEKVAIRLQPEQTRALSLTELGLQGGGLASVTAGLRRPHGLILVTGPIGSGKSTTLYSLLTTLNLPGVNISTLEDPVQYQLPGINQTPVDRQHGSSFATELQALLDQDPDIIMVGELPDQATAQLVAQTASARGLILSTLPTSPAPAAALRLIDLGVEPFLAASTLALVINQRLVRRLCEHCKVAFVPEGGELDHIKQTHDLPAGLAAWRKLTDQESAPGETVVQPGSQHGERIIQPTSEIKSLSILDRIAADPNLINRSAEEAKRAKDAPPAPVTPTAANLKSGQFLLYQPGNGCEQCHDGYKGRIGLFEVLENTETVSRMIAARAAAADIQHAAELGGMLSLALDGLVKSLEGITTLEEVEREIRE